MTQRIERPPSFWVAPHGLGRDLANRFANDPYQSAPVWRHRETLSRHWTGFVPQLSALTKLRHSPPVVTPVQKGKQRTPTLAKASSGSECPSCASASPRSG